MILASLCVDAQAVGYCGALRWEEKMYPFAWTATLPFLETKHHVSVQICPGKWSMAGRAGSALMESQFDSRNVHGAGSNGCYEACAACGAEDAEASGTFLGNDGLVSRQVTLW